MKMIDKFPEPTTDPCVTTLRRVVRGDSMEPMFPDGEVLDFRLLSPWEHLAVGRDYLVFSECYGYLFSRLVEVQDEYFVFKGTNRQDTLSVPRCLISQIGVVAGYLIPVADKRPKRVVRGRKRSRP
jgi:hypothetical protein